MAKAKAAARKRATTTKRDAAIEFNHAMIYVRDLPAALKFYSGQLGCKLLEEYPGAYARLQAPKGKTTIALHVAKPEDSVASEGVRLYFEVKELDHFCGKLQSEGVNLTQSPKTMPWGWRHAYLNDPDGHEISLYWAGAKRFAKTVLQRSAAK